MARKKQKPLLTAEELASSYSSASIRRYPDGKYRWMYSMSMLRNPTILLTVYRFMAVTIGVVALMMGVMFIFTDGLRGALEGVLAMVSILGAIFGVLGFVAYIILAAMYGGQYTVLFEMDESGLLHTHIREQRDKARVMGNLAAALSAAQGSFGGVLAALSAGRKSSSSSSFSVVSSVKGRRRRNVIYVNELFSRNHVYVADEDYDFVYNFIVEHCPKAKVK